MAARLAGAGRERTAAAECWALWRMSELEPDGLMATLLFAFALAMLIGVFVAIDGATHGALLDAILEAMAR